MQVEERSGATMALLVAAAAPDHVDELHGSMTQVDRLRNEPRSADQHAIIAILATTTRDTVLLLYLPTILVDGRDDIWVFVGGGGGGGAGWSPLARHRARCLAAHTARGGREQPECGRAQLAAACLDHLAERAERDRIAGAGGGGGVRLYQLSAALTLLLTMLAMMMMMMLLLAAARRRRVVVDRVGGERGRVAAVLARHAAAAVVLVVVVIVVSVGRVALVAVLVGRVGLDDAALGEQVVGLGRQAGEELVEASRRRYAHTAALVLKRCSHRGGDHCRCRARRRLVLVQLSELSG